MPPRLTSHALTQRRSTVLTGLVLAGASVAAGAAAPAIAGDISPLELLLLPAAALLVVSLRRSHLLQRLALLPSARSHPLARPAVAAMAVALVLVTWNGVRVSPNLTASDPFLVIAGVLGLVAYSSLNSPRRDFAPNWVLLPAAVILLDALFDALITGGSFSSLLPGLRLVAALVLTPAAIALVAGGFGSLWLLVDCWLFSVAINSLVGASDYLLHTNIGPSITGIPALGRTAGLTTQSNHLAFVTVMALPVIISRLLTVKVRILHVYYATVAVVAILALLSSGSRGGLVGGVLAVIATPFFQPAVRARAIVVLTSASVILALVGAVFFAGVAFVTLERATGAPSAQFGVSESDQLRLQLYNEGLHEFDQNPVTGIGFAHVRQAHIVYLQLLASGGVVAMLAFTAFLLQSVRAGTRLSRLTQLDPSLSVLAGATATSMAAWAVMGFVENQLYDRYLLVPCGFLLAVAVAATARPASPPPADSASRLPPRTLLPLRALTPARSRWT